MKNFLDKKKGKYFIYDKQQGKLSTEYHNKKYCADSYFYSKKMSKKDTKNEELITKYEIEKWFAYLESKVIGISKKLYFNEKILLNDEVYM